MILKLYHLFGLDDNDLENIRKVDDKFKVFGVKSKDIIISKDDANTIVRIEEITEECNKLTITEGRKPENVNEMLMEYGINEKKNINVGDSIEIDGKMIKIVGSALSTDHLIRSRTIDSRGTSTIGSGRIDFCLYAPKEYFDFDYYTAAYVVDEELKSLNINSNEYNDAIKKDRELLNGVKGKLEDEKYNKIIIEANKKIDEEEEEVNTKLEKVKNELDNAKLELDKAKEKLDKSKKTLESSKKEIENAEIKINEYEAKLNTAKVELDKAKQELDNTKGTLDSSKKEIDNAESKINEYENELNKSKAELDSAKLEFENKLEEFNFTYNDAIDIINQCIEMYGSKEKAVEELKKQAVIYNIDDEIVEMLEQAVNGITGIEDGYIKVEEGKKELEIQKSNLKEAKEKYNSGLSQYESALKQYNDGYNEYSKNKRELDSQKNILKESKNAYNSGLSEYNNGLEQYNNGLDEYNKNLEEYNKGKTEAEEKIRDARNELKNIEKASFYISDRNDNYEYSTYLSLCKSFDNLSKSFPVIFFIVAIFVSLLSMARMAIENRTEMGTLKALGFTNKEIRLKYILYSLLATLTGGIIGALIGNYGLSYVCYLIFNDMYQVPIFEAVFNLSGMIIGNIMAVTAIVGATIMVINGALKQDATTLLRPIAPPIGKKILLEKFKPLWNRMSFSNKLMARNIFRYKRRVIMSMLGFIGCTSLLISGYAIKDSMINIIDKQFAEISDYDQIVNTDGKLSNEELDGLLNYDKINKKVYVKTTMVELQNNRATLIVPDNFESFKNIFNLKDYKTGQGLELKDNEVIVTVKLAENLNKKVGDEIEFVDNNVAQKFKISAIAENYVDNFIYINKDTYSNEIDTFYINCAFIKFDNLDNNEDFIEFLNENEHVLNVISVEVLVKNFKNMLRAFDAIIQLLVVFSALLSFVVMYSLAYITISERQKEIATLKVLGYYNKDVDKYILKEQLNITIIGILLGILLGSLYSNILVTNINFSQLYLVKQIEPLSYIKTAGYIASFALIVSVGVHFVLKKIKMIESLKSIE